MPKKSNSWYDKGWLIPTLAILSCLSSLSAPFREDIREAVGGMGEIFGDWLFDFLLVAGLVGLIVVLLLKSDRAFRACQDIQQELHDALSSHRKQLKKDMSRHRTQVSEDLGNLVNSKLQPITDNIETLKSNVSALSGRMDVLDSRITALKDIVEMSANSRAD